MFKHSLFFTFLAAGTALTSGSALASDGTITFSGTISASSCTVTGGPNLTVNLPTLSTTALASVGAMAGAVPFQITLTGCTGPATTVRTYFEPGANTDLTTNDLKNSTGSGFAANVEVRLTNSAGTQIKMGLGPDDQGTPSATLAGDPKGAVLNYMAQYRAIGAVTAGTVNTNVTYSIDYR